MQGIKLDLKSSKLNYPYLIIDYQVYKRCMYLPMQNLPVGFAFMRFAMLVLRVIMQKIDLLQDSLVLFNFFPFCVCIS